MTKRTILRVTDKSSSKPNNMEEYDWSTLKPYITKWYEEEEGEERWWKPNKLTTKPSSSTSSTKRSLEQYLRDTLVLLQYQIQSDSDSNLHLSLNFKDFLILPWSRFSSYYPWSTGVRQSDESLVAIHSKSHDTNSNAISNYFLTPETPDLTMIQAQNKAFEYQSSIELQKNIRSSLLGTKYKSESQKTLEEMRIRELKYRELNVDARKNFMKKVMEEAEKNGGKMEQHGLAGREEEFRKAAKNYRDIISHLPPSFWYPLEDP